jgi:cytochrome c-type biogenesis protein CcmH/NrfG
VSPADRTDERDRHRLEAERDFLLRSLDDLDRERDAGGIDDDTYAVLHADYTARAAAATRTLSGVAGTARGTRVNADDSRHPRRLLTSIVLAIMVLAITLVVLVSLAPRNPSETVTGNQPDVSTTTFDVRAEFDRLTNAVEADPEDAEARRALGLFLFQGEQYGPAIEQLREAVRLDPDNVEGQTFYGWGIWQLAQQAPQGDGRDDLVDIAIDHLLIALERATDDASVHTFLGVVLFRGKGDAAAAVPHLERAADLLGDSAPPFLSATLEEARATVAGSTSTRAATSSTASG